MLRQCIYEPNPLVYRATKPNKNRGDRNAMNAQEMRNIALKTLDCNPEIIKINNDVNIRAKNGHFYTSGVLPITNLSGHSFTQYYINKGFEASWKYLEDNDKEIFYKLSW